MDMPDTCSSCKRSGWSVSLLLLAAAVLYLGYYPWFMYHNLPSVEGMFHLNSQSVAEAFDTAVAGWKTANARFGEFCSYFFYAAPLHVLLSVVHPLFMLLLAVGIQRLGTGEYPRLHVRSLLIFVYISLFVATASPVTEWWLDNLNWVYPCGVAMLFFALCEPLLCGGQMPLWRLLLALLLSPIAAMGNEILALTVPLLFLAGAGVQWWRARRFPLAWRYWLMASLLVGWSGVFFSSPCWSARMDALGVSRSVWERLAPIAEWERYLSLSSPAYAVVLVLTLAGLVLAVLWRGKGAFAAPRALVLRMRWLVLVGVGYLLLTLVIPGYFPHREYRCLQFFGMAMAASWLGYMALRPYGTKLLCCLLLPVAAVSLHYMSAQMMDTRVRMNLLESLRERGARACSPEHKILWITRADWNNLVAAAHVVDGSKVGSTLHVDRLVLSTDVWPDVALLQKHKWGMTLYSVYTVEEQRFILLVSRLPSYLLHSQCSPDILLNRALAKQVGLEGIVVVE